MVPGGGPVKDLYRAIAERVEWLLFDRPRKHLILFLVAILVVAWVVVGAIAGQLAPSYCLPANGSSSPGVCAQCGTKDYTRLLLDQPPNVQAEAERFCAASDPW
jgi:hypothetical protein